MRLKEPINFPLHMIVDVGVRSFKVRLEDDGTSILRYKVVQRSNSQPNSAVQPRYGPPYRSTHEIPPSAKGKQVIETQPRAIVQGKTVEIGFGFDHPTGTEDGDHLSKLFTPPEMTVVVSKRLREKRGRGHSIALQGRCEARLLYNC